MHLSLDHFDGPLDLLLHLIKTQEINIFNIPVLQVCDQFLEFLSAAQNPNFYEIGEYLVMAAQLIEIKASFLLPNLKNLIDVQSFEEMDPQDPRRNLVQQLLDYEALKAATQQLNMQSLLGRDVFESGASKRTFEESESWEAPLKGDPYSLVIGFERLLLQLAERQSLPTVKVRAQRITIHQKMSHLKMVMRNSKSLTFRDLFQECQSRYELIVTLMALLELAKAAHLNLEQNGLFDTITITWGPEFQNPMPDVDEALEESV